MLEPTVSPRPSVVAIAASLALLGVVLGGCQDKIAAPASVPEAPSPTPLVIATPPAAALDRAALLAAMDAAASEYASGTGGGDTSLVGRRLVFRQAFGCGGPASRSPVDDVPVGLATWSRSEDGQSLRQTLTPADWTASPLIGDGDDDVWEAVEGFWVTRPWMKTEDCPRTPSQPLAGDQAGPSRPSVGLASVFEADGSRLGRRNGRAYDHIVRAVDDQPPVAPTQGYRLILEGRMVAFPDGSAVRCRATGRDDRPVCIGAVQLDRVAFEDATGAVLSEWRAG